jgi:anti-sigma B factor antagonist
MTMVEITSTTEENYKLIQVIGEVDASSSIQLDNAIKSAFESEKKILVDLSGLSYISSAGLGVFVSHLEEIETKKITLVLFGLSENVMQIFNLLGLPQLLKIVDSKEEAIETIN